MFDYKCWFMFNTNPKSQLDLYIGSVNYSNDGICAFTNGFWITNERKFTKGSDCKYWIPPSQILYIEKQEIARKAGV